jgi:hypothetical protein
MRVWIIAGIAMLAVGFLAMSDGAGQVSRSNTSGKPAAGQQPRTPVLVELFTSEGCSSCPPADALLMKLDREQPVAQAEIITLGEHVDYWNALGWPDRFSSPAYSQRQSDYTSTIKASEAYTPQMIVDGRTQFVGSDTGQALAAIRAASSEKKAALELTSVPAANGAVRLQLHYANPPVQRGSAKLLVAVTESGLTSQVRAGENSGRKLAHASVVRDLRSIAQFDAGKEYSADLTIQLGKDWKPGQLRAVGFVQDAKNGQVLAAAQIPLASE